MNGIFFVIVVLSTVWFLFFSPDSFLPTLLSGAEKAASLSVFLLSVYVVWMGFLKVTEDCGLHKKLAKRLKPAVGKLFFTDDEEAIGYLSMNLSANMLGVSGAATPYGIKAAQKLKDSPHARVSLSMLLVVNATSVQLFPTTTLSLLTACHAENPASVVLPGLICTLFTTATGIALLLARNAAREKLFRRPRRKKPR